MEAKNKKLKEELEAAKERYRKMWHLHDSQQQPSAIRRTACEVHEQSKVFQLPEVRTQSRGLYRTQEGKHWSERPKDSAHQQGAEFRGRGSP